MTSVNELPEGSDAEETPPAKKNSKGKSKSPGFIESTSFKPSWLETGPLSPDMLPPELVARAEAELSDAGELPDDLVAQLAELERLYNESGDTTPALISVEEMTIDVADSDEAGAAVTSTEVVEAATEESSDIEAFETAEIAPETSAASDEASRPQRDEVSSDADVDAGDVVPREPDESVDGTEAVDESTAGHDVELAPATDTSVKETPAVAASAPKRATPPKAKPKRKHPFFDGLARKLLILGLILLSLAALTYFVNPFARLALSTAELARPVTSPALEGPPQANTSWCVTGGFLKDGEAPLPMQDNGNLGDIVAGDRVYALQLDTLLPGTYPWQVIDCETGKLTYPAAAAWIQVTDAAQPVTFLFDSEEHDDPLFFPIPFTISAFDGTDDFQVVGSFQDWNPNDASTRLQHLGGGVYQQVRHISRPGTHEAYVIAGNPEQAIDAYGRTSDPIPFSFETSRRSDTVVFLLDTNRGRASVLYGMPWVATQLAYGSGFRVLSLLLGLAGLLLLAWMLLRMIMMGNDTNWLEAGCPQCGRHELMRISRRSTDRMLNVLGIPAYRYQCRDCTWTGTRLSEDGASVSPGAATIMADIER